MIIKRPGWLPIALACALLSAPAARSQESAAASDPLLDKVEEMLESARSEIREFRDAGGEENDPDHPGRRWADELWRFRDDNPGTAAADRATTESIHFRIHAGQAAEAITRARQIPIADGAWQSLINILFEASEAEDDYRVFLAKSQELALSELEPEKWARLRFRAAQAHWVEGDFPAARAAIAEIWSDPPAPEWTRLVTAAREELGHPEIRDGDRSWRSGRDLWQRPGRVMVALGAKRGSRVADVGSGRGYFSLLLAQRVGSEGSVHAVDLSERALEELAKKAEERGLTQIRTVTGAVDDPKLPTGELDGILVVDTYHEMTDYETMLAKMSEALNPGGRLVVVDIPDELGRERTEAHTRHKIPAETVIAEAGEVGLRLHSFVADFATQPGARKFYLLSFRKPEAVD